MSAAAAFSLDRIGPRPPHNIEVEQAVLGALLLTDEAFPRVAPFLEPEHFYDPVHGRIYADIAAMIRSGQAADARALKSYLRLNENIGPISVTEYVTRLLAEAAPLSAVGDFGRLIRDLSVLRRLAEVARDAERAAFDHTPDEPVEKLLERVEGDLAALRTSHRVRGAELSLGGALQAALDAAGAAYKRAAPAGWPWFMPEVERVLDMRIEPGNLYGLLGASGDGKTSFVLQLGRFLVEQSPPVPFLFLSGEQSKDQCIWQMHAQYLSAQAEMGHCAWTASAKDIRDGKLTAQQFDLMAEDAQRVNKLPIAIQKWAGLRVADIGARVRAFVRRHGPAVVAIDNAAKVRPDDPRAILPDRVFQIGEGLKDVAGDNGSAIILLSHRNSDNKRRNMRPVRGDMYGQENALKNLDGCLALYRAERWLREKMEVAETKEERTALERKLVGDPMKGVPCEIGRADFYALKSRFGEEGRHDKVRFVARYTRFAPLEIAQPGLV